MCKRSQCGKERRNRLAKEHAFQRCCRIVCCIRQAVGSRGTSGELQRLRPGGGRRGGEERHRAPLRTAYDTPLEPARGPSSMSGRMREWAPRRRRSRWARAWRARTWEAGGRRARWNGGRGHRGAGEGGGCRGGEGTAVPIPVHVDLFACQVQDLGPSVSPVVASSVVVVAPPAGRIYAEVVRVPTAPTALDLEPDARLCGGNLQLRWRPSSGRPPQIRRIRTWRAEEVAAGVERHPVGGVVEEEAAVGTGDDEEKRENLRIWGYGGHTRKTGEGMR
jgi:hypothetical protein